MRISVVTLSPARAQYAIAMQARRFFVLWGLAISVALLLSQSLSHYTLPIDTRLNVQVDGVSRAESGDNRTFRFTAAYVSIGMPGLSQADYLLQLNVHNGLPQPRTLRVATDVRPLATFQLKPGWQSLRVFVPADAIGRWEVTHLILQTDPGPGQSHNTAGVPIARLTLDQLRPGGASFQLLVQMLACVTLLGVTLLLAGLPSLDSLIVGGIVLAGMAVAGAAWRVEMATLLPRILTGQLWGIGLAALAQVAFGLRWRDRDRWWARAVMLAIALFIVHTVGMLAPQFLNIDHLARAHQLGMVAAGEGQALQTKLSNQPEWGNNTVPYSLLSYRMLVPLVWVVPDPGQLATALKVAVSLIDAIVPLLLYRVARLGGGSGRAAWFAALLYASLPATHLYFHDGSYPTILGAWVAAVALLALAHLMAADTPRRAGIWFVAASGALAWAMLMYVTQVAFAAIVAGGAGLGALVLGSDADWRNAWRALGAVTVAFVLVIVAYYGAYIWPFVSRIGAQLTTDARPGYDSNMLPGPLVGSFWQQAWGHTRWLPIPLALIGVVLASGRRRILACIGLGYGLLLTLTSLVDLRFSLWNKHWYFAVSGLALLAALALDRFYRHGRVARLVVVVILLFLAWESFYAWAVRVLFYEWSLRTL